MFSTVLLPATITDLQDKDQGEQGSKDDKQCGDEERGIEDSVLTGHPKERGAEGTEALRGLRNVQQIAILPRNQRMGCLSGG